MPNGLVLVTLALVLVLVLWRPLVARYDHYITAVTAVVQYNTAIISYPQVSNPTAEVTHRSHLERC